LLLKGRLALLKSGPGLTDLGYRYGTRAPEVADAEDVEVGAACRPRGAGGRAGGAAAYGSRFSRHDYTQPQLFALLVLKQFLRTDYRGLVALVAEWRDLRHALGLRKVPHHSTLAHAARRLLAGAEKGGPSAVPRPRSSPAPALPA
jgi:hypothetical protein